MFRTLIFICGSSLFPLAAYGSDVLSTENSSSATGSRDSKNIPFPPSPPLSPYQPQLSLSGASATPPPTPEQKENNVSLEMNFRDGVFEGCSHQTARGCLATCGILSFVIGHAKGKPIGAILSFTSETIALLLEKEKADAHKNCIVMSLRALKAARHRFPGIHEKH